MKVRVLATVATVGMLSGGCIVQSLDPFYTGLRTIVPPGVEGAWIMVCNTIPGPAPMETNQTWIFTSRTNEHGLISYHSVDMDRTNTLRLVFFDVEGRTLCDVTTETVGDMYRSSHLAALHTLGQVTLSNDVLRFTFADRSWFKKAATNGTLAMTWRHYQNSLLVTQTGPDWKAFFGNYGGDPALFNANMFMEFRRAGGRIHGGATALDNASQKVRIEVPRSAIRTALAAVQLAGGPEKYARLPGVEPIDPVVREYWDKGVRVRNIDEFTLVQHRQYGWGAEDKGHNPACGLNVALTTD